MSPFRSGFADELEAFVRYRKASESWNEYASRQNLLYFDHYCADNYDLSSMPIQAMIDGWCTKRDSETSGSCYTRTLPARQFIEYLKSRGLTDINVPASPKLNKRKYVPHPFSDEELRRFFEACDSIIPYKNRPASVLRKIQCPAFFRLLYSSGIRTTEARYLKRSDVDLSHGVLDIQKSKGYDQHYVALHETMTELLVSYDNAADRLQPDRTWFFQSMKGGCYGRDWVNDNFKKLWQVSNGDPRGMIPYDLRHHYAIVNISSWEDDSFSFSEKLHYLSKSMGHRWIQSTLYYYSIVPRLADKLREKPKPDSMISYRRCGMKKIDDAPVIARRISEFLYKYAPQFLTNSENTLKGYSDALTLYFQFLEESGVTPSNLDRHHLEKDWIEKWILWLKENRKNSPETCNNRLASLRRFLEYLASKDIKMEYLYQESKRIKRQKCPKRKVSGLSREAVAAMLEAPDTATSIGRRDLVFLTILYATAARMDEVLSIKIGHINLDVNKPYVNIYGKGDKLRTSYLLPRAVALLRKYMKEVHGPSPDPDRLLFYSRVGENYKKLTEAAMDKRIKIYARIAHDKCSDVPIKSHAHLFRHAKASHWIEDGLSIVEVQFLLGHEQIETTMKYLDITTAEKVKALATLENEKEKKVEKKWKNSNASSLTGFCGLNRK